MIETNGTCACGVRLVPCRPWVAMSLDQRKLARSDGINRAATSTECKPCYERRIYREQRAAEGKAVTPFGGSGYTREQLLDEMDHLNPAWRNQTIQETCRTMAPKLGLQHKTLEQRLRRYGIRSRFDNRGRFKAAA